jgi:hypothetical protein
MNSHEEKKRLNEYKQIVSRIILKIYTSQQKIIDELNLEIIQLKMLSQKQCTITFIQETNLFTDKITGKSFKLDHSDHFDDSDDSE